MGTAYTAPGHRVEYVEAWTLKEALAAMPWAAVIKQTSGDCIDGSGGYMGFESVYDYHDWKANKNKEKEVGIMPIRIVAEKLLDGKGERKYYIKSISGLGTEDLPMEYLYGMPRCYVLKLENRKCAMYIISSDDVTREMIERGIISEAAFEENIATLHECKKRLATVNQRIAADRETWKGDVEVEI